MKRQQRCDPLNQLIAGGAGSRTPTNLTSMAYPKEKKGVKNPFKTTIFHIMQKKYKSLGYTVYVYDYLYIYKKVYLIYYASLYIILDTVVLKVQFLSFFAVFFVDKLTYKLCRA